MPGKRPKPPPPRCKHVECGSLAIDEDVPWCTRHVPMPVLLVAYAHRVEERETFKRRWHETLERVRHLQGVSDDKGSGVGT